MARPTLLGISHTATVVSDLRRAEAFYVGLLGLAVVTRHEDERGHPRSIWVALEGDRFLALELAEGGATRADEAPGHHCLALRIAPSERARWRAHLAESGIPIVRETGFTMYVRDPDGALIGLSHYPVPRS